MPYNSLKNTLYKYYADFGVNQLLNLGAMWRYRHTVLLISWFGWISIYLCRSVLPPILPVLFDELGISHAQGGLLETAYLFGYIVVKLPAGVIANRIGIKKTLTIGIVGYALSTSLNFLATSFTHLLILRLLLGLFQGVHLPLANTLLSERFGSRQGRAIGFHESGPNVGNTIALPITVAISIFLGWRWAFLLISIPAFILAVATAIILKDESPSSKRSTKEVGKIGGSELHTFSMLLIPLALAHSVYNLCLRTLLVFTPSYLLEFKGMSLALAGMISMLMPATGIVAKVSSGFVGERVGEKNAICWAMGLTGLFILSLTFLRGGLGLSLVFMLMGLGLYSFSPIIYSSVTSSLPSQLKSLGLGVVTTVGNTVGAFSTFLIGYMIDAFGYQISLQFVSGSVLLSTLFIFFMMRENVK
jgi:MFS family permease